MSVLARLISRVSARSPHVAIKAIGEYIEGVQENDDIVIFDGLAPWAPPGPRSGPLSLHGFF